MSSLTSRDANGSLSLVRKKSSNYFLRISSPRFRRPWRRRQNKPPGLEPRRILTLKLLEMRCLCGSSFRILKIGAGVISPILAGNAIFFPTNAKGLHGAGAPEGIQEIGEGGCLVAPNARGKQETLCVGPVGVLGTMPPNAPPVRTIANTCNLSHW